MRKGKRFIENENLIIYVGTAIFFVLAISVGIVMYMTTKMNTEVGEISQDIVETQNSNEEIEDVSIDIGKTVEEQETTSIIENEEKIDLNEITSNTQETISTTQNNVTSETVEIDEEDTATEQETTVNEGNEQVIEVKEAITFIKPTDGEIITEFAQENLIYSETLKEWITHTGIDIKADKTSVIKASADGVVSSILNDPRYGLTIVISHDEGYETVYSNLLTAEFVVEGEEVTQGQTIGTAGNTAAFESNMDCHLHFELLQDGQYLDPSIYLK